MNNQTTTYRQVVLENSLLQRCQTTMKSHHIDQAVPDNALRDTCRTRIGPGQKGSSLYGPPLRCQRRMMNRQVVSEDALLQRCRTTMKNHHIDQVVPDNALRDTCRTRGGPGEKRSSLHGPLLRCQTRTMNNQTTTYHQVV